MNKKREAPTRAQPRVMARRIVPKEPAKPPTRPRLPRAGQVRAVVPVTFKTRRQWHWRRLLRVPWLRIGAVLIPLVVLYLLLGSGTFRVRQVEAIGDAGLPVSLLRAQCRCIGSNIFLLRPDSVRQRLQHIPTLVVSDVYGRLPNRVVVEAHFKKPRAIWRGRNGFFLADDHGELIARATGWVPLPVIAVRKTQKLAVGQFLDAGAMTTVGDLIRYLPPYLRARISGFYYSPISGITVAMRGHWSATIGWLTGSTLQGRIIILQWALQHDARGRVPRFNYIDLRYSVPYARWNRVWLDPQWVR
ncbi:MAG: hypothetical protein NVSMB65_10320 [Chloroflexota bacterium]